jgi:hypothetical protein
MKFTYAMNEEERKALVRRSVLRNATALHNACMTAYKENQCKGCPFTASIGCKLYGHPIEWKDLLNTVKPQN